MREAGTVPSEHALERLGAVRGFVFDMDGTLVLGDRRNRGLVPLPGALELTRRLTDLGVPFAVVTNGTTRPPRTYASVLRDLGFAVADDAVITPASSAAAVFNRRDHRSALVLGGAGLVQPLEEAGVDVVPLEATVDVDGVVAGWYPEFGMPGIEAACHAVWGGARLYSCSQSLFFATADGRQMGTSRVISAAITGTTGCDVEVVGKPAEHALHLAADRCGVEVADLAVVGDDPELEVPMAHAGGALAIAVDTGIGDAGAYGDLPPERQPHVHVSGVADLLSLHRRVSAG
jgi:NagD protein